MPKPKDAIRVESLRIATKHMEELHKIRIRDDSIRAATVMDYASLEKRCEKLA